MDCFARDGIEFHYEALGRGRPLIFSHGLAGSMERVREFVENLPDVQAVIYDNRAHGRTQPLGDTGALTFARMADDMAALLDHLSIAGAIVGGVSMGAGIALACALRHPSRAKALVFSRPAWLDAPSPGNLGFAPVLADLIERHGLNETLAAFQDTEYYRALLSIAPGALESLLGTLREARDTEALAAAYRRIPLSTPVDSMDRLRELRIPALVLGNANDPFHPVSIAETWARRLPEGRLQVIPSRFYNAAEHLRQFRAAIQDFLAGVP